MLDVAKIVGILILVIRRHPNRLRGSSGAVDVARSGRC